MYVVIVGCGRVGRSLATKLITLGHQVGVIDCEEGPLKKLGGDFPGTLVLGQGYDPVVLREAGIEKADAFAAVSSGDNTNIIAARVAREEFGVERVIARIYDGRRAEIYERLGIPTVATVPWAADRLMRELTKDISAEVLRDPSRQVAVIELSIHPDWTGHLLSDMEQAVEGRSAFVLRGGRAAIPTSRTRIQAEDHVWFAVLTDQIDAVRAGAQTAPVKDL